MAKKCVPKKLVKKPKMAYNKKDKIESSSLIKRLKLRHPNKNKKARRKPKNFLNKHKIIKNFIDAQSTVKLQCCVCFKEIHNEIKIILEPMSPRYRVHQKGLFFNALCINCFILNTKFDSRAKTYISEKEMTGATYKYTHYRILRKMSDPLFTEDWSLGDEVKLLGAIEKLGIENWEEISKYLNKGKCECQSHYYAFYYKDKDNYLIDDNTANITYKSKEIFTQNKNRENNILLNLTQNYGYFPFSENNNKQNRTLIKQNQIKRERKEIINQNIYDNLGYYPMRNEFEVEYNNDAEILLSEVEFNDNDNYEVINNNYKILVNYNNILDERDERKKVIADHHLLDVRKQMNFERKLSNEDREIFNNLKENTKYLTKEQFLCMFESSVLEKNLKTLLKQLYMYRDLGLQTYEDVQNYIKKESAKINNEIITNGDDKMKLRDSTINLVNKTEQKLLEEKNIKSKSLRNRIGPENKNV